MKGYFAVDLIVDMDDKINILDSHGLSDAISFSESAGYIPRKSCVHRFMGLLNDKAQGKDIVYFIENRKQHKLPSAVLNFFNSLPEGVAYTDWIDQFHEFRNRLTHQNLKREILFLDRAAKKVGAKFHPGWLTGYGDQLYMKEFFVREMMMRGKELSFDEIGLILNWGNDYLKHPGSGNYWVGEVKDLPVLNSSQIHYVFNSAPKSVAMGLIKKFTSNVPDEIYVGMGRSSSEEIEELVLKHDYLVKKPLCTHCGVGVEFLSQEDALKIVSREKKFDKFKSSITEQVGRRIVDGFEEENGFFNGYFMNQNHKGILPLYDMGSFSLQERIFPRPFKSGKTGNEHTGTIRAQILFGQPIGVMHRFSKEEYRGKFQNIVEKDVRTFWEKVDDSLEGMIVDFLEPLFAKIENEVVNYDEGDLLFLSF